MRRLLTAAARVAVILTACNSLTFAADVGISVDIGQPGFYGRLDIGGYPLPRLIYGQPRYIEQVPMDRPPIYMRVPPGHARNWSKHCREYDACGERVFFVRDSWYRREYVPRYREQHRDRGHEDRGERRDDRGAEHGHDNRGGGNRSHGRRQ